MKNAPERVHFTVECRPAFGNVLFVNNLLTNQSMTATCILYYSFEILKGDTTTTITTSTAPNINNKYLNVAADLNLNLYLQSLLIILMCKGRK